MAFLEFRAWIQYLKEQGQLHTVDSEVDIRYDIGAALASGSFRTAGMVVAPCSIKTLSAIANSYADNLLVRAADVVLKERRRLVLVLRETPLHLGHLRLMSSVVEYGAVLMPPVPAFYTRPQSIDDIINQTVGRILDQFELDASLFTRWEGLRQSTQAKANEQAE